MMIARQNHMVLEWLSLGLAMVLMAAWVMWVVEDALALIDALEKQPSSPTYADCQDGP